MEKPVVVFDNGTGYSKLGFSGNYEPSYIIPTVIATRDSVGVPVSRMQCEDLNFYIGEEAYSHRHTHIFSTPLKEGQITNWDDIERFWQRSIYHMMRVAPEEHVFLLTEPALNPPENREQMAEIMFETFNVKGLYIGVQPVLALYGANLWSQKSEMTGTVIDSGDGTTYVIPVAHGYAISSCIKQIPFAGRDITKLIAKQLRDRGEAIAQEDLLDAARVIKENFCYACKDFASESALYNNPGSNKFKVYEGTGKFTGNRINVRVGVERFLGPETFFNPGKLTKDWDKPIEEVVDSAIQACPIDLRRDLYSNIVLSGGSTMFQHFNNRLGAALQKRIDERLDRYAKASGNSPTPIRTKISSYQTQKTAVWFGASMFAAQPEFTGVVHTRESYLEHGPSIARMNVVFGQGM